MAHAGDPFRALYEANHERVRRVLARIVGPQEAEDLTQTVFAKAAKALPSFRGDAETSTWLYRIAANVASDWLRGRPAHEARLTIRHPDSSDEEMAIDPAQVDDSGTSRKRNSPARTCASAFVVRSGNFQKLMALS
jgi:RNA polymerase sigma factor (sigma-70 family)